MKVAVLGGDGFCGWPAALRLSAAGHDVWIIDNLSRRKIDLDLETESLTPIQPMTKRLRAWKTVGGRPIQFLRIDVALNYHRLLTFLREIEPDAVVHFAEQRSAPYSMKSSLEKRYTVDNNVTATHNLLCAIVESGLDVHVVHLGTMGVYGYSGAGPIPEGYVRAKFEDFDGTWLDREILSPADPGSVYHMTKTLDQLLFVFYNKNDSLRITDLHQGVVWGTATNEASQSEHLINRFDYDGEYGTVLNRFVVQAAVGHPLTVYGSGGPDESIHPYPRFRRMHPPGGRKPAGARRARADIQPDDRDPSRSRTGPAHLAHRQGQDRICGQSAAGSGEERPDRGEQRSQEIGSVPHHARARAPRRDHAGREEVRRAR